MLIPIVWLSPHIILAILLVPWLASVVLPRIVLPRVVLSWAALPSVVLGAVVVEVSRLVGCSLRRILLSFCPIEISTFSLVSRGFPLRVVVCIPSVSGALLVPLIPGLLTESLTIGAVVRRGVGGAWAVVDVGGSSSAWCIFFWGFCSVSRFCYLILDCECVYREHFDDTS